MANLNREFENKTSGTTSALSDRVQNLGPTIEKISHNIGSNIGSAVGQVSDKAVDYIKTTRKYVEENPMQSLAIATATGVALGSLLTFAMRRRH